MIPQHGDNGNAHGSGQLLGQQLGFLRQTIIREVSCQDENVCALRDLGEERLQGSRRILSKMNVTNSGDANYFLGHGMFLRWVLLLNGSKPRSSAAHRL